MDRLGLQGGVERFVLDVSTRCDIYQLAKALEALNSV